MKIYVKAAGYHNKNTTPYDVITLQMLSDNDGTLTLDNGYVIKNCEPNWLVRHPYTTVFVPQEDAEYIFSTPESAIEFVNKEFQKPKFTQKQYKKEILAQLNRWINAGYYGFIEGDKFVVCIDDGIILAGTISEVISECDKHARDYDDVYDIVWSSLPKISPDFGKYDRYDKQKIKEIFESCGKKIPKGFWG